MTTHDDDYVLTIARIAFEQHYDRTRKFEDLNPNVISDWRQKTKAILAALRSHAVRRAPQSKE
jgi:hypothetical protein